MQIKYNESLSNYNSENQKSKDKSNLEYILYHPNNEIKKCSESWLRLKDYVKRIESLLNKQNKNIDYQIIGNVIFNKHKLTTIEDKLNLQNFIQYFKNIEVLNK